MRFLDIDDGDEDIFKSIKPVEEGCEFLMRDFITKPGHSLQHIVGSENLALDSVVDEGEDVEDGAELAILGG